MAKTSTVKHISECFIKPKYEPEDATNPIYLAPYDLAMFSVHYIQKGLLFPKPSTPFNDLLDDLKHSLSAALVHFYPLAGRLETLVDEDQKTSLVFIDCKKGPGARLIHATLDMSVSDILSPRDVPRVVQSFFDHDRAVNHEGHTRPLLSIQATELLDGVFIGCSINHACADGTSYWHFFNTWSEIFMAKDDRIAISRPPIHAKWFIDGTGPIVTLPFTRPEEFVSRFDAPELRERIFRFSPETLAKLKKKANSEQSDNNITISSFQALSALMWRCITRARGFADDVETRCRLAINNRGRLNPPLPNNYYGNSIQTVQGSCKAGELLAGSLGSAALLLNRAVAEHSDKNTRGFLENWMRSPFVYQLSFFDPCSVMMGSSPRFDMYGNEFGMGKALAVLSGYANKFDGKVTSYPGRQGGGSIDLEICLLPDYMRAIEADAEFMEAVSGAC